MGSSLCGNTVSVDYRGWFALTSEIVQRDLVYGEPCDVILAQRWHHQLCCCKVVDALVAPVQLSVRKGLG